MPYDRQCALKTDQVKALFADAGYDASCVKPLVGMENPYRYRNKVISPFAPAKGKGNPGKNGPGILTGMYAAGSHRLVATGDCPLENQQAQQVIKAIKAIMLKHGMQPYDEDAGTGFVRHAVVRAGHESGEVLVTLVTNGREFMSSKAFCRELVRRCPFVTSVVQNVNTRQTNVILGQEERRLYGPGFILDTLCGLSFRISSQSFYQVNSVQTEVLYRTAMDCAQLEQARFVLDAYCGTGTIGLVAASMGQSGCEVTGVDSSAAAIRDARENARHNGIDNAQFFAADATGFMRVRAQEGRSFDVVFMDPPRTGSTDEFMEALASMAPQRVVYISCNPQTQVRDLRVLSERGYALQEVQPVDMFPHTKHVETVALMLRG